MPQKYDPDRHHRRSIRLKEYDYTRAGAYFLTICTKGRACVLGEVVRGEVVLSEAGLPGLLQMSWSRGPKARRRWSAPDGWCLREPEKPTWRRST